MFVHKLGRGFGAEHREKAKESLAWLQNGREVMLDLVEPLERPFVSQYRIAGLGSKLETGGGLKVESASRFSPPLHLDTG